MGERLSQTEKFKKAWQLISEITTFIHNNISNCSQIRPNYFIAGKLVGKLIFKLSILIAPEREYQKFVNGIVEYLTTVNYKEEKECYLHK